MNKKLFFTALSLLFTIYCNAQSWQWGKRGGSFSAPVSAGFDETAADIATDRNGNIYILSDVWSPGLDIDGHAKSGYGGRDILLSSFKCDGTYRWSKILGGAQDDKSAAVKTDSSGGVYISGYLISNASSLHIDADSTWAGGLNKTLFLAKFDTSGAYKWFRMPQADTVGPSSSSGSAAYDMDVDAAGNIYWLCNLAPGAYVSGGYVVTANSVHMLKYNSNGIFQSGVQMQITYSGGASPFFQMKRNHKNGKYVITGNTPFFTTITFGTTTISHTLYLGCFNSAGTCLWTRQNTNNLSNGPLCRPDVDAAGNIYVTGQAVNTDNFNSYIVTSTLGPYGAPMVVKLDSAGNHIWGSNGQTNAVTQTTGIIVNGGEVAITGSYPGKLKWGSDSLRHAPSCGNSPFVARLNTVTGALNDVDSLQSACGDNVHPTCIAADKSGNFYIAGYMNTSLTVNGTTLTKAGGGSDFFVAKYGTAICGCTVPTSAFSSVGTHTVNFTYSGTATYDSVRWNFGDGGTSTLPAPVHVYTMAGTYTVCVTVYTPCGSDVHCQTVTITIDGGPSGITPPGFEHVAIYPNPVLEQLIVDDAAEGTLITLYNILGREVYTGVATGKRHQISMQALPPGTYVIQLTGEQGNRMKRTLVKQ